MACHEESSATRGRKRRRDSGPSCAFDGRTGDGRQSAVIAIPPAPWPLPFLLFAADSCGGGGSNPPAWLPRRSRAARRQAVANEGWLHVAEGSAITYHAPIRPPRSRLPGRARRRGAQHHGRARPLGPTTGSTAASCSCYRPMAPASAVQRAARRLPWARRTIPRAATSVPCWTADPDLPTDTAVVAADFMLEAGCTDAGAIRRLRRLCGSGADRNRSARTARVRDAARVGAACRR